MTRQRQVGLFWLGALALLIVCLFVFRQILLPFVAGMALAYGLDPIADRLQRAGLGRLAATVLILTAALVVLAATLLLIGPVLVNQLIDLVTRLPSLVERLQELFGSVLDSDLARFLGIDSESVRASFTDFMASGAELVTTVLGSLWTGGLAIVNLMSLFVVTPFVAFYLLRDWDQMIGRLDRLLPLDYADEVRDLARAIDRRIAAFVRGQILVGVILGIFYATGLVLIGLNYGLLIGLASGLLSFIPYLGFAVGFALSIVIALVQFWPDWVWLAATVAVFMIGQFIEGYILQPRLIGPIVGLHPVWLFFSLFAFGLLFGFVGLLIAVPAGAAIGVLLRYAIDQYRASGYFSGRDPNQSP
jgi:predicted PurR-regulated permease PerM